MKRFLCLALVLALLMITLPVRAEKLTALWTANPKISAPIYSEPSTQSKTLGRIYQGASVKVYSFDPEWAYINSSGVVGYCCAAIWNRARPSIPAPRRPLAWKCTGM